MRSFVLEGQRDIKMSNTLSNYGHQWSRMKAAVAIFYEPITDDAYPPGVWPLNDLVVEILYLDRHGYS